MPPSLPQYPKALVCPSCKGPLEIEASQLHCAACDACYVQDRYGYWRMMPQDMPDEAQGLQTTTTEYAQEQHQSGQEVFEGYLRPLLFGEPFCKVLDVGCGIGRGITSLSTLGIEAYGIDLPVLAPHWATAGNARSCFVGCSAAALPFKDDYFDVVYSLGVIEHIGTLIGQCTLSGDFRERRREYAKELVRVTRPGGRIIVACPNKAFPVDVQHGPTDGLSPRRTVRAFLYRLTGMNLHKTWGAYHLLSYAEVNELFCLIAGASRMEPLPLAGYFGFRRFRHGFLRLLGQFATVYVNGLPRALRGTFLNPYVLVMIRK